MKAETELTASIRSRYDSNRSIMSDGVSPDIGIRPAGLEQGAIKQERHETGMSTFSDAITGIVRSQAFSSQERAGMLDSLIHMTSTRKPDEWRPQEYGRLLASLPRTGNTEEVAVASGLRNVIGKQVEMRSQTDISLTPESVHAATADAELAMANTSKEEGGFTGLHNLILDNLSQSELKDPKGTLQMMYAHWEEYKKIAQEHGDKDAEAAIETIQELIKKAAKQRGIEGIDVPEEEKLPENTELIELYEKLQKLIDEAEQMGNEPLKNRLKGLAEQAKTGKLTTEALKSEYQGLFSLIFSMRDELQQQKPHSFNANEAAGDVAQKFAGPLFDVLRKRMDPVELAKLAKKAQRESLGDEAARLGPGTPPIDNDGEDDDLSREQQNNGDEEESLTADEMAANLMGQGMDADTARNVANAAFASRQRRAQGRQPRGRYVEPGGDLEELPYEEKDRQLYEGTIDQTIEERMMRILFTGSNPDATRYAADDQYGEAYQRISELDQHGEISETDRRRYYRELRRWVGTVLKNDYRESADAGKNQLRLTDERYEFFKQIRNSNPDEVSMSEIQNNVRRLWDSNDGRLLRYFQQYEDTRNREGELVGVSPAKKKVEDLSGYRTPQNLEATMELIVQQYGPDYDTGGKFQLIDEEGTFHYENFYSWARAQANLRIEENPADPVQPLSEITLRAGYSELSLAEILYRPSYLQEKPFIVIGDEQKDPDSVQGGWGRPREHEKFGREQRFDLIYEMNWRGRAHSERIKYIAGRASKKTWYDTMQSIHGDNYLTRSENIRMIFTLPSRGEGNTDEFDDFYEHGGEGTVGKGIRETLVAYSYLTSFTDFAEKGDEGANFEKNMLYKFLEPNGANTFLFGLAEGSLNFRHEAKQSYRKFLQERINATAGAYETAGLTEQQRTRLQQLREVFVRDIGDEAKKINISLTSSSELSGFREQVERIVLGKQLDEDARKEIDKAVEEDILTHLKGENGLFEKFKSAVGADAVFDNFTVDLAHVRKFMDYDPANPPDPKDPDFIKFFNNNLKFAEGAVKEIAKLTRKNLNYFNRARFDTDEEKVIDGAIKKSIAKVFGLNDVESTYASLWAKDYLWPFGIAAYNDTTAISFDYWTRLIRTARYRARQEDKSTGGNELTIEEIKMLSMPTLQQLRMRREGDKGLDWTLFEVIQGGKGTQIVPRSERRIGRPGEYKFRALAQSEMVVNNLRNASDFMDILQTDELRFAEILTTDPYGRVIFDQKKAFDMFKGVWGSLRYSFEHNDLDFRQKVMFNGKEVRMLDLFFGEKTQGILEMMRRQRERSGYADAVAKDKKDRAEKKDYKGKSKAEMREAAKKASYDWAFKTPSAAVLASLIGAEIAAHRDTKSPYKHWTIQNVIELKGFLDDFFRTAAISETYDEFNGKFNTEFSKKNRNIDDEMFDFMIRAYGQSFEKMYGKEFAYGLLAGIMVGIMQGIGEFTRHSITTKAA